MTPVVEQRAWTRRRWIGTVFGVLAIQVAAVALLVRPVPPPPSRPGFATRIHLLPAGPADGSNQPYASSPLVDPALFALPSIHGFSGLAWLRYPSFEPRPAERVVDPEWLKLTPSMLGLELARFLATNPVVPLLLVDEPLPSVLRYEKIFSGEPVDDASRLRVEGDLARRTRIGSDDLPSWPHTEIVSNTIVRASVDAAGRPFSATLLSRSGLPAADDYAVQFVENERFEPLGQAGGGPRRTERLEWGTFVFLWHTRPMPVTNAPPEP